MIQVKREPIEDSSIPDHGTIKYMDYQDFHEDSNIVNCRESPQEPTDIPSEKPTQVPTEITDFVLSITASDHHINPTDENYFYYVEVMNSIMDDNDNGDTDVNWYDTGYISAVRIINDLLQVFFNSVIVHEENFDHPKTILYADILQMKANDLIH